jgi:hypothetical protein
MLKDKCWRFLLQNLAVWTILFLGYCFFFMPVSFGGQKMEPLYDLTQAATLEPQTYRTRSPNLSLFPVPQDNAVGTNDMGNAITLLSFRRGRLVTDTHFRNAAYRFAGGGTYLPVIDQNTIGFAQSRRFLLFDFKKRICRDYDITTAMTKNIERVAIADARQKHFIFEIQAHNPRSEDPWDFTSYLLLMDLSMSEPKILKELNIGKTIYWTKFNDKIIFFDLKNKKTTLFDLFFEKKNHPFTEIINKNIERLSFTRIFVHPELPFAILSGGRRGSTLIKWEDCIGDNILPLIDYTTDFTFSPDGNWVVLKKDYPEPHQTYLMPVSEKYPNYLGSPIKLLDKGFGRPSVNNNAAWTTNPISYVGSYMSTLYRWELTSDAYPEAGDMDLHDYIVQKDLEKLTREKRQGLGQD